MSIQPAGDVKPGKFPVIKVLPLMMLTLLFAHRANAQEGAHTHDGFYLSAGIGAVGGNISSEPTGAHKVEFYGLGTAVDIKAGVAVSSKVIIHLGMLWCRVNEPRVNAHYSATLDAAEDFAMNEYQFGIGLTYYLMPQNVFLAGTAGMGYFSLVDHGKKEKTNSDNGFAMQLRVGKEWWLANNLGMGVGFFYAKTHLTNKAGLVNEKLDSNRFGVTLQATFD